MKTLIGSMLLVPVLLSGAPVEEISGESAATVREEFQGICKMLNRGNNGYYGTAQIEEMKRYAATPVDDPRARAMVRARLGAEMLRIGDSAEAVRLLSEARQIADDGQLDPTIRIDILRVLGLAQLRLGEQRNCVAMHGPASCILPLADAGIHSDPAGSLAAIETYKEYLGHRPGDARIEWLLNVAAMTVGRYPEAVPAKSRVPPASLQSSFDIKQFRDVAFDVGLDINQSCGGGIMDDFDGDGLLDIVSSSSDPCSRLNFFRNDGKGGFEDWSDRSQLSSQLGGINVIHADYDNDGDLDLYIGNEVSHDSQPFPAQLFRNNGDGTFKDVARAAGVENGRMVKGVAWGDYDDDGDPDLYVSNIGPNRLYRNNGDGTFADVAVELGTTGPDRRSFPTWFFDYDNDGKLDLFVADYTSGLKEVAEGLLGRTRGVGHPRIYHNLGGKFEEVGQQLGLDQPCLPMGANFGDLDNDGDQDIFQQMGGIYPGDAFPSVLYENPGHGNHWITLRLIGTDSNRSAIGARIRLTVAGTKGPRQIHALVGSGGSFGGSSLQQEIGLGGASRVDELEIVWPTSGKRQRFKGLAADRVYEIREDAERPQVIKTSPIPLGAPRSRTSN